MRFFSELFRFKLPPPIRFQLFAFLFISLAIIAGYRHTLNYSFQLDDESAFIHNPSVQISNLKLENFSAIFSGNRPIPNLTFALNYYFGGLNPWSYHIVNILFHIMTSFLVYLIFLKTASMPFFQNRFSVDSKISGEHISLLGALFWALHPVQTEAVTYTVQRMTSLGTFFYLFSLLSYINGRSGNSSVARIWFIISILSAVMAFASKENTLSLPLIILLYDLFFISRFRFIFSQKNMTILLGTLSLFFIGIVWILKIHTVSVFNLTSLFSKNFGTEDMDTMNRLMTEWRVLVYYLSLLVYPYPARMNLDYDFPISRSFFDPLSTFLSLLTILSLLGFACFKGKKYPLVAFSILWFFVNLIIESTFIKLDLVFEHRLYLPSVMFFLLLSLGIYSFACRFSDYGQRVFISLGLLILILLGSGTYERNKVWATPLSLWSDVALKSPMKERVLINLGEAYLESKRLKEARITFEKAIRLNPKDQAALNALGYLYHSEGKDNEAIRSYNAILELNREDPAAHLNLGVILAGQGKNELALQEYQKAAKLRPDLIAAHLNAGIIYSNTNRLDQALVEYQRVLQINSEFPSVHTNLGQIYFRMGKLKEAVSEFNLGLRYNPTEFIPQFDLGYALDVIGQKNEAIEHYEEALKWAHPADQAEVETIYKRLSILKNLGKQRS
ncbi:MAG: tetratricopeptide repeat protein [Nitrospiria bacterium]